VMWRSDALFVTTAIRISEKSRLTRSFIGTAPPGLKDE
jgi:hypothetical protein